MHKQQDIVQHIGNTRSLSPYLAIINVFRVHTHCICNDCSLHKNKFLFAEKLRVGNSECAGVASYTHSNGMIIYDNELNGNHYIGTNFNGLMAGPVVVNGSLTVDGHYVVV